MIGTGCEKKTKNEARGMWAAGVAPWWGIQVHRNWLISILEGTRKLKKIEGLKKKRSRFYN